MPPPGVGAIMTISPGTLPPPNPPVQEGGVTVRGPSWDRVRGWPVPEGRLDKAHAVRGIHAPTCVDPLPLCTEEIPLVIVREHKQVIQCSTLFALLLCR